MSKQFRNINNPKPRSASTAFISLHFNKADEDQLEISYGDKAESDDNVEQQPSLDNILEKSGFPEAISDENKNDSTSKEEEVVVAQRDKSSSRDSTPSRDSVVRDYWSRISKRAGSLDSDLGAPDKNIEQNEGWMFFKDIKGKLTKTLEERKLKDGNSKNLSKDIKISSGESLSSFYKEIDPDRTPTENSKSMDKSLQLSPAIEVVDGDNLSSEFEDYVEGELEKAKCEIISTVGGKLTSTPVSKTILTSDESINILTKPTVIKSTAFDSEKERTKKDVEVAEQVKINDDYQSKTKLQELCVYVTDFLKTVKLYWNSWFSRLFIAILALCLVPVPSWFSGFIAGAFISGYVIYCLLKPAKPREKNFVPEFSQLSVHEIPVSEVDEPIIYKGWMNELPFEMTYNPETYHVNCTRSLYVRLDGSYLRVSYPQTNIPKRAMFNEPRYDRQFIHQQHYDITEALVELLPVGLIRKRLWSKKYPICLTIPNSKQSNLSSASKDSADISITQKSSSKKDSPIKKLTPRINENNEVVLYLFARTDREKDLWYYRFKRAAKIKLLKSFSPSSSPDISAYESVSLENKRTMSADFCSLQMNSPYETESNEGEDFINLSMTKQQKFELYMSRLLAPLRSDPFLVSASSKDKKNEDKKMSKSSSVSSNSISWLNMFIGRLFFDFLTEDEWAQCVAEKIQKKLSKLKLPVFLKELTVKDINLGSALPKIHRASEPNIDQKGLWIDIDLSYNGSFQMTLETKINLLRYRCDPDDFSLSEVSKGSESINQPLRSPVYNSDEEDSAESSSDEDFPQPEVNENNPADESSAQSAGGSTGKKLLRLVDRFAQSTYFQHAAKNKYIKKAMEDISNTPLVLTVEVQWLAGTLALNIPPMPTDRLWYGFRTNPYLSIVARPKLGHHAVTITHITEWIERKLVLEFQKLLVMPNMDDLIIPIMQPDLDLPKS